MEIYCTDLMVAHTIIVRVLFSLLLGLIIGFERSIAHKKIGFRTLSLVCVGSACFTLISIFGFDDVDTSRIAAQVVSGIGFLGAGAILHTGYTTRGLTTATALWVAAAIGMACGTGMFVLATVITLVSLVVLWVLKPVKARFENALNDEKPKETNGEEA